MFTSSIKSISTKLCVTAGCAVVVGCASYGQKPQGPICEGHAFYQVTFDSTWTQDSHPKDFPSKPHYSHLFGATHNAEVSFWSPGTKARDGIKDIAERGVGFKFIKRVDRAIFKERALAAFDGNEMANSPGKSEAQFKLTSEYPQVTLINMLAPSPDWITGVSSLNLCQNGQWADSMTVSADVYDAGTDDGKTYTAADIPTPEREAIALLGESNRSEYGSFPPVGTFEFTKIDAITNQTGGGYTDFYRKNKK